MLSAVFRRAAQPHIGHPSRRRLWLRFSLIVLVLSLGAHETRAQGEHQPSKAPDRPPIRTLQEVWPALVACWRPPSGSEGMEITIRFSVKRTGEVIGTPMITYSKLFGPPERQKAFVVSVLDALARCTPLNFAGDLGDAVVSRIISIQFVIPSPIDRNRLALSVLR